MKLVYVCLNCGATFTTPNPWYARPDHSCSCRVSNGICHNQFQVVEVGKMPSEGEWHVGVSSVSHILDEKD